MEPAKGYPIAKVKPAISGLNIKIKHVKQMNSALYYLGTKS